MGLRSVLGRAKNLLSSRGGGRSVADVNSTTRFNEWRRENAISTQRTQISQNIQERIDRAKRVVEQHKAFSQKSAEGMRAAQEQRQARRVSNQKLAERIEESATSREGVEYSDAQLKSIERKMARINGKRRNGARYGTSPHKESTASRLERKGPPRTASREKDDKLINKSGLIRTRLDKVGRLTEEQKENFKLGQDDFRNWLYGRRRNTNAQTYNNGRELRKYDYASFNSIKRHKAKEKGKQRIGTRYKTVQAAHKPAVFRDFEAERLERLENSRRAIKERQRQPSFAEKHPLKPRDFEAERLESVRAREEEIRQRQSQKIEPASTPEPETAQGPIAQSQEASSTPTGNQQNAGATQGNAQTNNQEAAGATQGGGTTSNQEAAGASSGSGDDSYDAKLKALRKKGRANEYAADRIDQERKEVIDMINAGNYKDAAGALGFSGDYTAEKANELRQAAEKHAMDAVNEGAGIMDYVNAYHVPGAIGGAAILAGTGVALMSDNGRKSNEQLYSSPF